MGRAPTSMLALLAAIVAIAPLANAARLLHTPYRPSLKLDNGLGKTPPMGWNSWNHFGCNISEAVIRDTADTLVSTGLAALGYKYVNIDDCWSALQRDEEGKLLANPVTFPSGIKALAHYVHSKGLKLGIYSDAGFMTCESHPGSLGYEKEDAKSFAEWGVDYLKYDNCFSDLTKPEVRYPVMRDALMAVDRPIFFSMCEWGVDIPAQWADKVGNSWRTTTDIRDTWESMTTLADLNNEWADFAGPGGWNDPDMLEVGNGGMTTAEYKAHFSIWSLMKAPLLIGCDVTDMSEDTKSILMNKEVIAVNQDPLGKQGKRLSRTEEGLEVWAGPLSGGRLVVAFWNRGNDTATISADWNVLGLEEGVAMKARDLWKHEYLTEYPRKQLSAHVESHDVAMYVLEPEVIRSTIVPAEEVGTAGVAKQ